MKLTRITQDISQITVFGFSNCYLVREPNGYLLVDCTVPGKAQQIMAAARMLVGEIHRVVLTHAHLDHTGSLDELVHLLGHVDEVAIGQREEPLLQKDLSLRPHEPQARPKGSFSGTKTKATRLLRDGDRIGHLEVIDTPGHTPGHISLLDTRDGTLIAGDALTAMGSLRVVTDPPWYFPLTKMATWDAPTALASARRMLHYRPRRIVCGHGTTPIESGTIRLEEAINRAR